MGARDGREALSIAREVNPDLVVTDWNMPRMTGLELCHELQRSRVVDIPGMHLAATLADQIHRLTVELAGVQVHRPGAGHPASLAASMSPVSSALPWSDSTRTTQERSFVLRLGAS